MFTLLLIFVVAVAVIGSRAAARRASQGAYQPQSGYGPQYGVPPAQPGMGGHVMGGLATGVALGAGALAAQEIGRRMLGEGHPQDGTGQLGDFHPASDSQLAHDAGIDSVDGAGSWSDAGSFDGGGDGGGGGDS